MLTKIIIRLLIEILEQIILLRLGTPGGILVRMEDFPILEEARQIVGAK